MYVCMYVTIHIVPLFQISVDTLSWDFTVMTVNDSNIMGPPKVGSVVKFGNISSQESIKAARKRTHTHTRNLRKF